ncbi:unnamed protein product [Moneuplotes crassus]|uniref:RING-type domain-containing protein n=1 Tax=Euplotes crassus TaxID=5936 RepID=A0AAD1XGC4_EUPCR|nr:unnamed protein product [Moneuplotes crassus]
MNFRERLHKLVTEPWYLGTVYALTFVVVLGLLVWRMTVGGKKALVMYLCVHVYMLSANVIHPLMVIIVFEENNVTTCTKICCCLLSIFFIFTPLGCIICTMFSELFYNDPWPEEAEVITICLFSIPFLALYIPLPIVFDESKDAGFWIGYSLLIYLSIYCHLIYFWSKLIFDIEWETYLNPVTWIVALVFFIWYLVDLAANKMCKKPEEQRELDHIPAIDADFRARERSREYKDCIMQFELHVKQQDQIIRNQRRKIEELKRRQENNSDSDSELDSETSSESSEESSEFCYEDNEPKCPIDLEDFNDGRPVKECNRCNNKMHEECYRQWFNMKKKCPLCGLVPY